MKALGIFSNVNNEAGLIIVAEVNTPFISEVLKSDGEGLRRLITGGQAVTQSV
jgi:hypothetical protein